MPDYSAFTVFADGDNRPIDQDEVKKALPILFAPGERHEIRSLPGGRCKVVTSDDVEAAAEEISQLDGSIYFSLNPIKADAVRANVQSVTHRRWLLVDIDPVRPSDVSATDTEKAEAGKVVDAILEGLPGWPEPVVADSGNGYHLLFRVDLPNDKLAHGVVKQALAALDQRFSTDRAKVDTAVHDAPRICKLPGTWSRKGPDIGDRPHRRASINFVPSSIKAVDVALIQALGGKPDKQAVKDKTLAQPSPRDPFNIRTTSGGKDAYVKTAITMECVAVSRETADGHRRNTQLAKSAFKIGTMADWPEMDGGFARAELRRAAIACLLPDHEACDVITRQWEAGRKSPRPREADEAFRATSLPVLEGVPLTIGAHEVNPEKVSWLWQDRIATGFISLFAGRTGVGKSFVLCDIAARLSRGDVFPDESPASSVGGTLFISEDPYQYVLVPRLIELKADLHKIGFMRWEAMAKYSLADTSFLDRAWEERGRPALIVIDPPANFLGANDEHKNSEVRGVLMRIVAWLESRSVAMVLITHYNKGGSQKALDALDRIMGSVAWSSSSRVACGFMVDPDDQSKCIFGGIKNNLGEKAAPLSYQIKKTDALAVVEWLGKSETSLEDAMNQAAPKKADAAKFFIERFTERLEWESDALIEMARKAGIGRSTCFEVKKALGIQGRKVRNINGQIAGFNWFVTPYWEWFKETDRTLADAGAPTKTEDGDEY